LVSPFKTYLYCNCMRVCGWKWRRQEQTETSVCLYSVICGKYPLNDKSLIHIKGIRERISFPIILCATSYPPYRKESSVCLWLSHISFKNEASQFSRLYHHHHHLHNIYFQPCSATTLEHTPFFRNPTGFCVSQLGETIFSHFYPL